MLKTVYRLAESQKDMQMGNHSVVIEGDIRQFKYFGSTICMANYNTKKFMVSYCDKDDNYYLRRAIRDYRNYFSLGWGYELVSSEEEVKNHESTEAIPEKPSGEA